MKTRSAAVRYGLLLMLLVTTACTTLKPVPVESFTTGQIVAGDDVRIVTRDGKSIMMHVTAVSAQEVWGVSEQGQAQRLALDQIALVERADISVGRSVLAGGGIYLGAIFVGFFVLALLL